MGVSKEDQERVFDPFFTTKSRGQGTGLGLSIAHGIVQDHLGHIHLESPVGNQGTRITVQIPLCDESPAEDESHQYDERVSGKSETILIAEDHPEIQKLMSQYFEDAGYQVLSASDGDQVLALFEEHQKAIQLMILDVDLPKRSGVDCLKTIQESHVQIPTILISGPFRSTQLGRTVGSHSIHQETLCNGNTLQTGWPTSSLVTRDQLSLTWMSETLELHCCMRQ